MAELEEFGLHDVDEEEDEDNAFDDSVVGVEMSGRGGGGGGRPGGQYPIHGGSSSIVSV